MQDNLLLEFLGRSTELFQEDYAKIEDAINEIISNSSFLVLGGSGTIGSEVVKTLFQKNPKKLHIVSLDENGTAELVRDIRSSLGYITGDFRTFVFDVYSDIFEAFLRSEGPYDYVLNFSAVKHIRSEKDPYSLMRMVDVNVLSTLYTLKLCEKYSTHYFSVSSTKAVSLSSLMGATKRLMEYYMIEYANKIHTCAVRFPNIAFSNGSLLGSYTHRLEEQLPIVAPVNQRYFMTPSEAAKMCLLTIFTASSGEIYFPKLKDEDTTSFSQIAERFLKYHGYTPYVCESEEQARKLSKILPKEGKWACYFFKSDTTGEDEKDLFFYEDEDIDTDRFKDIGIVKYTPLDEKTKDNLLRFVEEIERLKKLTWTKQEIIELFKRTILKLNHKDTGIYLEQKM